MNYFQVLKEIRRKVHKQATSEKLLVKEVDKSFNS